MNLRIVILVMAFMSSTIGAYGQDFFQLRYPVRNEKILVPLYLQIDWTVKPDALVADTTAQEMEKMIVGAFNGSGHELESLVKDVGDGFFDERKEGVNGMSLAIGSLCAGASSAKIERMMQYDDCISFLVEFQCDKTKDSLKGLLPMLRVGDKITLAAERFNWPDHLLFEEAVREGLMIEAPDTSGFQAFNIDATKRISLFAKTYTTSNMPSSIGEIVGEYYKFWQEVCHVEPADIAGDSFHGLLERFEDSEKIHKQITNSGLEKWLKTMPRTGRVRNVIDVSPVLILITDDYCTTDAKAGNGISSPRRRFVVEILRNGNDWKIINYFRVSHINRVLASNIMSSQICSLD